MNDHAAVPPVPPVRDPAGQGAAVRSIAGLAEVAGDYAAVFCDVWGVVHDGLAKHADAEAALLAARRRGLKVVLLTNSPRRSEGVARQLDALDVTREAYDRIVTSGDVTRALIAAAGVPLLHIGPARDADLFAGLGAELVGEAGAGAIVATGLADDEREGPGDYAGLLERAAERGLPMICANPDIVVHRGSRVIWCAGALARDYAALGGEVRMAGKPHGPIYELACRAVAVADPRRILAVGDGLNTDIRGANAFGADALLVVGGIHGAELGGLDVGAAALAAALTGQSLTARYFMPALG